MKIVYTGGSFEILNPGQINLLKQCKKLGDRVVVSLNTDEFIESYKGHKPVISYEHRKIMLEACKYVDEVVMNIGGRDSKPSILLVKPQIIVIGTDWISNGKCYYSQMQFTQKWLDDHDITLAYVPYTEGISTTEIKKRILTTK